MQYSVTEIVEQPQLQPNGKLRKAYRVSVSVGDRAHFTLSIPEDEFTPEEVEARAQERVKTIAAIMDLK